MRARNTPIHRWMGHDDMITALQFDGFKLVTAGMDSVVKVQQDNTAQRCLTMPFVIKVWDVRATKALYTIQANEGGVRCLQFCGGDLVVGGSDGIVSIYRHAITEK